MTKRKRMGRPRLKERERHPHGGVVRRSVVEQRDDAVSVALEARQRQYGARPEDAAHVEWESALGRLYKQEVDEARRRYEIGCRYRDMRAEYDRIMGVKPMRSGSDVDRQQAGFDARDGTDDAHRERDNRVREIYRRCFLALLATGDDKALGIIERVAVEDQPAGHLVESLRLALNAVGKVLR
jgi:hypothetical protein